MIHLALMYCTRYPYEQLSSLLREEERVRLNSKKNDGYRRESAAARLLAAALFERVYGREAPPIVLSPLGAPTFFGESVSLSISHSHSVVAACIADAPQRVGIDLERATPEDARSTDREQKLRERLCLPTVTELDTLPPIHLATLQEDNTVDFSPIVPCEEREALRACGSLLRDYTALEAVMKGEGKGFAALGEFPAIYPKYALSMGVITDAEGAPYLLTLARRIRV